MSDDSLEKKEAPKEERVFSQDEVNALVGKTRAEAAERAKRQMESELQQKAEQQRAQYSPPHQQQESQQGGTVDINAIEQQIMERLNQQRMEEEQRQQQEMLKQQVQLAADNYVNHMSKGKEKYADFDEITQKYRPEDFPELTFLVSSLDNAADVVYELYKNDDKLAQMAVLAKDYPKLAEQRLKSLGDSISSNQSAIEQARQDNVPAPLDRMQPSQVSGNSDQLGVSGLRKQDWLKG